MSDFAVLTKPRARKWHRCDLCGRSIVVGERYFRYTSKWDGEFYSGARCVGCNQACAFALQFTFEDVYEDWDILDELREGDSSKRLCGIAFLEAVESQWWGARSFLAQVPGGGS